jgi:hypothetical protein
LNEADGQHVAGYDRGLADQLAAEAADIVRALGFMAVHVVLIGGLVPGLLVPVLDPGIEPHIGTADIDLTFVLPQNKGTIDMELRVTGPLAFLMAKIDALRGRDKPKDAYDIVWLIESWPGGPVAAAASFAQRPAYRRPEVAVALDSVRDAFAAPDRIGARSYARFVATAVRGEAQLARRAVGAIAEFIAALPDST